MRSTICWRRSAKWEFNALKAHTIAFWQRAKARFPITGALCYESASSGIALGQEIKRVTSIPAVPIVATLPKLVRLEASGALYEAGRVVFPESAPWLKATLDELARVPTGHDDCPGRCAGTTRCIGVKFLFCHRQQQLRRQRRQRAPFQSQLRDRLSPHRSTPRPSGTTTTLPLNAKRKVLTCESNCSRPPRARVLRRRQTRGAWARAATKGPGPPAQRYLRRVLYREVGKACGAFLR
jgi:predicted phage terminase large subunit-like protein